MRKTVLLPLSLGHVDRMKVLSESSYRPQEISELKQAIEEEMRSLEFRSLNGGVVTQEDIDRVVAMKLKLDSLYIDWLKDRIG